MPLSRVTVTLPEELVAEMDRTAPNRSRFVAEAVTRIVDPVPQALVLTAIVIGLGVTTLMLAYAYRLFAQKGTLDIAKFTELKW